MLRIEVWFNNGLFRAFPQVKGESIRETANGYLMFSFGSGHKAHINLANVNFMEQMEEVAD